MFPTLIENSGSSLWMRSHSRVALAPKLALPARGRAVARAKTLPRYFPAERHVLSSCKHQSKHQSEMPPRGLLRCIKIVGSYPARRYGPFQFAKSPGTFSSDNSCRCCWMCWFRKRSCSRSIAISWRKRLPPSSHVKTGNLELVTTTARTSSQLRSANIQHPITNHKSKNDPSSITSSPSPTQKKQQQKKQDYRTPYWVSTWCLPSKIVVSYQLYPMFRNFPNDLGGCPTKKSVSIPMIIHDPIGFSLIFPSSLPIFPPFFPPKKTLTWSLCSSWCRWISQKWSSSRRSTSRTSRKYGKKWGKKHKKNLRNCGKTWWNMMKWQWTEETRRNISDLFNTLALFEMSKISGEVWKSSHSDYLNPISKHWSIIDKIIINNQSFSQSFSPKFGGHMW